MIVVGGDSFVYGSELADCKDIHSAKTFTALLTGDSDEYICTAIPGSANNAIARVVMSTCEQNKHNKLGVLVLWSFPGRYEFKFNYDTEQKTKNWYSINPWTIENKENIVKQFINNDDGIMAAQLETIERAKKTGVYDFAKTFYQHVGSSEYWEVYSTLKEIVCLQNYLLCNNIPYMFTCASSDIFYNHTIEHKDITISSLYNQIDFGKWFFFPSNTDRKGFWQWAVDNKYPMGTTHPLEQAHAAAAELMKEKFNELVKKNLE